MASRKVGDREAKAGKSIIASTALNMIRSLYAIEAELAGEPHEKILEVRQEKSLPILDRFKAWLLEASTKVLPSCPTCKAIS